jgi:acetylornithine deacetylase/succinyl-diaminopimelate desuccinylase-like protein
VGELLAALIRNECVNDGTPESGHEARSVATLQAYLGASGDVFETEPGRRSVLYRVPGRSAGAPRLALLGHLDVVPANPSTWTHDPFGGERHDGFIWGRGAVDMLNQTAAMAAVFRRYLSGEWPALPGDLLFLAVADEEAGGLLGAGYLVEHHWEAVACEYLLTEIGAPHIATPSGPALPVTRAEKGPQWKRLRAAGTPGHASQPYGARSALRPIAEAATLLGGSATPVGISPEWRDFVAGLGLPEEEQDALLDPDRIDDTIDRIAVEDPGYARWVHACTHLTVTPTVLHAGVKANVIADRAELEVDARALPGQDVAAVHDHFRKVLGPGLSDEIEIEDVLSFPATSSPASGPLWDAIDRTHRDLVPAGRLVPAIIPVATDARFFRARGTVAYGVAAFDDRVDFGDLLAMFHGNDERVSERSLELTADLFAGTLRRFGDYFG